MSSDNDRVIIDKIDCLQRDFAAFKSYIIEHFDEALDRALKESRKPKRYVEPGYR